LRENGGNVQSSIILRNDFYMKLILNKEGDSESISSTENPLG
jgi:hypothetical protein